MATFSDLLPLNNGTDANFRAWGSAISDIMQAGGWVQTNDTGQIIDWSTQTKPSSAGVIAGYQIWRSNDSAEGIDEIYVKFEFASCPDTQAMPNLFCQVGFASNGLGALTGFVSTRRSVYTSYGTYGAIQSNLSAGLGWFAICLWTEANPNYGQFLFSIERTRKDDLTFNNEVLFITSAADYVVSQVISVVEGVYPAINAPFAQAQVNPTYAIQGGNAGVSLQFGQKGGFTNPSMNIFGAGANSIGAQGTVITLKSFGEDHNYIINSIYPRFYNSPAQVLITRFE